MSGKFQGVIRPTTPSGSRNVMSTPPATGIVLPVRRSGRARVIAEGLDHHPDLAAGVRDRLARVAGLERRQFLGSLPDCVGQPVEQGRALSRVHRPPSRERSLGARDRGVGLLDARAGHLRHHLLGGRLDHLNGVLARHETTI